MKNKKSIIITTVMALGLGLGSVASAGSFHHLHRIKHKMHKQRRELRHDMRDGNIAGAMHHMNKLERLHARKHMVKRDIHHGWW